MRARAPLFDTAPFDVIGRPTADGKGAELWTVTPKGTIAAQATATLAVTTRDVTSPGSATVKRPSRPGES